MKTDKEIISNYFSGLGKKCLTSMTKKERKERARKAGIARWEKLKDNKISIIKRNEKNNLPRV